MSRGAGGLELVRGALLLTRWTAGLEELVDENDHVSRSQSNTDPSSAMTRFSRSKESNPRNGSTSQCSYRARQTTKSQRDILKSNTFYVGVARGQCVMMWLREGKV